MIPTHFSSLMKIIKRGVNSACKYFFFFLIFFFFRALNDNNSASVYEYGIKTATGPLKYHLMTTHLGEWIEEYEKLDITITGKQAQKAIAKYKGVFI